MSTPPPTTTTTPTPRGNPNKHKGPRPPHHRPGQALPPSSPAILTSPTPPATANYALGSHQTTPDARSLPRPSNRLLSNARAAAILAAAAASPAPTPSNNYQTPVPPSLEQATADSLMKMLNIA